VSVVRCSETEDLEGGSGSQSKGGFCLLLLCSAFSETTTRAEWFHDSRQGEEGGKRGDGEALLSQLISMAKKHPFVPAQGSTKSVV